MLVISAAARRFQHGFNLHHPTKMVEVTMSMDVKPTL